MARKWRVCPDGPRFRRRRAGAQGRPYKSVCISLPIDELAAIDALAERLMVERSSLIRAAMRAYAPEDKS